MIKLIIAYWTIDTLNAPDILFVLWYVWLAWYIVDAIDNIGNLLDQ